METARSDAVSQSLAKKALEELCRAYWYPLYAFVRYRGYSADDAQDLTQSFFARIIETRGFSSADRSRGRFRSYLLGALKHFMANEWKRSQAKKRGGQVRFVVLENAEAEARYSAGWLSADDADLLFDQAWAIETTNTALNTLRHEMDRVGKADHFDALKSSLTGGEQATRSELAKQLGITEGAVKVAVHRLRQRYRDLLRSTIAETVNSEADLDDEMRHLVAVLRKR